MSFRSEDVSKRNAEARTKRTLANERKQEPLTFEQLQARAEKRDRDDLLGCRAIRISWGSDLGLLYWIGTAFYKRN